MNKNWKKELEKRFEGIAEAIGFLGTEIAMDRAGRAKKGMPADDLDEVVKKWCKAISADLRQVAAGKCRQVGGGWR